MLEANLNFVSRTFVKKSCRGILVLVLFSFYLVPQVKSQSVLDDEGTNLWTTDSYIDETFEPQDPDKPDVIKELDDGGYDYYTDEEVYQIQREHYIQNKPPINFEEALSKSSRTLTDNIFYGVGAGIIIGGWLAIFNKGTSRENFQLVGTGAVLGGLAGFLVGTKAFYIVPPKNLEQPQNQGEPNNDVYGINSLKKPEILSGFQLSYSFKLDF